MQLTAHIFDIRSVAIGKRQTHLQMYFVAFGLVNKYPDNTAFYMTKVTVHCDSDQSSQITVFFDQTTVYQHLSHVLDVSPNGQFAVSCTDESLLIFDLTTLQKRSQKIFDRQSKFRPAALEISNQFIFLAGYNENDMYVNKLYLFTFTTDYNITIADLWMYQKITEMQGRYLLGVTDGNSETPLRILLALQYPNAVHLLTVNQSILQLQNISFMSLNAIDVAWLN